MLATVAAGQLQPERLVTRRIALDGIPDALAALGNGSTRPGSTVAEPRPGHR